MNFIAVLIFFEMSSNCLTHSKLLVMIQISIPRLNTILQEIYYTTDGGGERDG